MIQGISIENFRCFHKTEINGFGLVNLFGGKNNAGKTSLLEAIYASLKADFKPIMQSRLEGRDESSSQEYLFLNQNTSNPIILKLSLTDANNEKTITVINPQPNATLKMSGNIYDHSQKAFRPLAGVELGFWEKNKVSFILSKDAQFPWKYELSKEFDSADRKGESDFILKAIQVIEPQIVEIKTYSDRPNILHLRTKHQKQRLPLSYFGDAVQKVMRYIITIASFQNGGNHALGGRGTEGSEGGQYLLIDEIENGLHYAAHQEFWEMLFKLAVEYNIQIFAATHSREMIQAFAEVGQKPEFVGKATYFEMFRHVKTDEITANKFNINTLEYNLQHNQPLRGE